MRKFIVPLLAIGALALPASAIAGDDPPVTPVPPAFVPPTPAPVTDNATASAFAKLYVARNARDILSAGGAGNFDRRRVLVINDDASCLQHPVIATRFGCVFTLRALVISRRHGWDYAHSSRFARAAGHSRGHDRHNRRFRVRQFGCLGALSINGGPTVTPTATVRFVECSRVGHTDDTYVAPSDDDSDS